MIFQVLTSGRKESLAINYVGDSLSTGVITRHLDGNMLETYTDYDGGAAKTEVRPAIIWADRVTSTYR